MNKKGFNQHKIFKNHVEIYIKDKIILIDKSDLTSVSTKRWYISSYPQYPICSFWETNKKIRLHQFLLGKKKDKIIDHINGDIFDNRRKNLRFVSYRLNNMNKRTLGYCISKSKHDRSLKKIIVQMSIDRGKILKIHKRFLTIKEALKFRAEIEKKYLGFVINR